MKRHTLVLFLGLFSISLTQISCNSDNGSDNSVSYNKTELLNNIGNNIVQPSFEELATEVATLNTAIETFASTPDINNLVEAQTALKNAYISWQNVAYFDFGPAQDVALLSNVNIYPVDATQVENNIANGGYNLESAGNISAKGFPALDLLLYGAPTNQDLLSTYTTLPKAAQRIQYLKDVMADIKNRVDTAKDGWIVNGTYATSFRANTGNDIGSSIGLLINSVNQVFERHVRDGKIGIPAGVRNIVSGNPEPTRVEAVYAEDFSMELAIEAMDALENIMIGKSTNGIDGEGVYDYLDAVGAKKNGTTLSSEIAASIASVKSKMQAVNGSYSAYVTSNKEAAVAIFDEMQELVIMLKVDMPAAISVSIVYLDNDGD